MATPTSLPASFVAGNVLTAAQMNNLRGAFRILQVAQTVKTDTFTTSSATYVDITGLSVTITPSDTNSKILVVANVCLDSGGARLNAITLVRGSTEIYRGDAAGSRVRSTFGTNASTGDTVNAVTAMYLDSPATTSATTYKIQMRSSTGNVNMNRSAVDTDNGSYTRVPSSITVFEVSA